MALGDGIRRNFAHISQAERDRFVAAVKKMHDTLTFSDGVNYFSKQEQSHELAHGSAVSPHDPRLVVEGCDMTGSYITDDAGQSWRMFNLGWVVDSFAFDPSDPAVVYAANGALWRSEDAGRSWSLVYPDPARHTVEHGWGDHADVVYTTDEPTYPSGLDVTIHAVVVHPSDSRRLFLALSATPPGPPGSHPSGRTVVLGSEDRGRT